MGEILAVYMTKIRKSGEYSPGCVSMHNSKTAPALLIENPLEYPFARIDRGGTY